MKQLPWEIIVAIDGDDGTEYIVNLYSKKFPFVRMKKSSQRSGMGGGIKRGMLASTGEYLILMDGDGSTSLQNIIQSIELITKYDIVNFNRYSLVENKIPLKRRFASRAFNLMLKSVYGISVSDTQCGYKIMRRATAISIISKLTVTNAFFFSAFFIYAKKYRISVVEVPVQYEHSQGSKFNVVMTSMSYIISIIAFKIRNSRIYYHTPNLLKEFYYKKLRFL